MSRFPLLATSAILTALIVFVTWPQALHVGTQVAWHNDPHFSIWRLGWIAHALATDPAHLFDANIFYPARRTLAYSDAMLLEGALAAPFLWARCPPVVVYNMMLLAGMVTSGVGMFVLVRYLTHSVHAGLVAAAIFALLPYRIEHFMHLELQWTIWMPLAFWAVHRACDEGAWRFGVLAGILLWFQILSCVYYGIFLALTVAILAGLLIASDRRARAALPGLLTGALVCGLLTIPYARPYLQNVATVGSRDAAEVVQYSGTLLGYLASPGTNWIWGRTATLGSGEVRFFPGLVAIALAAIAFRSPRRLVWIYAAVAVAAAEMSLGLNGLSYSWLYRHVTALHGLRAPSRFAILALAALAVLAGFGYERIETAVATHRRRVALLVAALTLVTLEYASSPILLTDGAGQRPVVYRIMRNLGPGVLLELPLPPLDRLPGHEALYESWSTYHWHPLVNGYSGYYPPTYVEMVGAMQSFPDSASVGHLRRLGVRYIILHRSFFEPREYLHLIEELGRRPAFKNDGDWDDPFDSATLFELLPETGTASIAQHMAAATKK